MSPLTIKALILAAGVIIMAVGFTLYHFRVGNKDGRYILIAIGVSITVFTLVHLSTDIGTALFGVEGVNARMPKPNP
ncbi:hypothetical protein ERE_33890 [Agathobacter rectalis M104/1]|uniref:hypothetical protein n=1 Tax=Agathobacter rectalis TaxID=39491 RepID=UPI0001CD0D55|nr:hypothetical protein [Agathobacter rectalis]CBK95135.1 hypothetical protein ERE_33890 [Agathobacter rectalis M104/1]